MFNELIDRRTFEVIVKKYGADYQDGAISPEVIEEILKSHVENKKHIFKLFGNKLRVEKEIETTVSQEEGSRILKKLINTDLEDSKRLFFVKSFLDDLDPREFTENVTTCTRTMFDVKISKGTKVSKALAKLCLKEDAHEVVTKHSMALQSARAKGKIVVSIDPCDYVTMSSNNSGWRSCHRLDGGEYRTGPIAYLRDSSTVICYMESSTPCEFTYYRGEEFSHTNKVWRQIALVSPNLEFSLQERQYPNINMINQLAVSEIFKELFEKYNQTEYKVENSPVEWLNLLHRDFSTEEDSYSYYYNDIKAEMFSYGNIVSGLSETIDSLREKELPVKGEAVYCLDCGEHAYESSSLYCEDCGGYDCDEDDW